MTIRPDRYRNAIVPHIYVDVASDGIAFYKRVFGAVELFRMARPNGKILNAEISIEGSVIMIGDPSFGSDFNYDFHVTLDPKVTPAEYNYRNKAEMEAATGHPVKMEGQEHGLSIFFQLDDDIFHTYSAYARGCESLKDAYRLLDTTPYGRQQDFEESPAGWPQKPTYG